MPVWNLVARSSATRRISRGTMPSWMTDGSRSILVRVFLRYGTSTRNESVEVEAAEVAEVEAVVVVFIMVVEEVVGISISRDVAPEEEAEVVLLLVLGRIDGDNDLLLPRPIRAMEIIIIIRVMSIRGAMQARRGMAVEIRGTITDIHQKSVEGDGVEADPLIAMSGIGDARGAAVHVMMSADAGEVVVDLEAETGIIGSTITRATRRRGIAIRLVGEMTTTIAAIGVNERRKRGAIAVGAGPDPGIARRSPRGSIVVGVEAIESVQFLLYESHARRIRSTL